MGTESLQANIDLFIPGSIKIKGHGHCHHLSGYGSQGGPGDFHPGEAEQSKNHDGIQDDIDDGSGSLGDHVVDRLSGRLHQALEGYLQEDSCGTQRDDGKIFRAVFDDGLVIRLQCKEEVGA